MSGATPAPASAPRSSLFLVAARSATSAPALALALVPSRVVSAATSPTVSTVRGW
eukprot:CAMPEP_0194755782 /NCGR_PEP_ID=MMETSP0323_2-20130528/9597_1 /TAXON_ID=2866 ORGANISM="Crypthecodinium cohnii, Strain Seligo" /NCGR_SAMPLE_ID=MMETSP0323_2 /ASSEMBLY_ACC=CAM_ASM_000346 /LENGTH=54 /DNA_ID=CAMNT_0039675007 /DNA_START=626 /DNA_END=787 /DNA_ORIENTATION=-